MSITPGSRASYRRTKEFEPSEECLPSIRKFVRSSVEESGAAARLDEIELALSELATSAVRTARSPLKVVVTVGGRVRVEVLDPSSGPLTLGLASSTEGLGLVLVEQLASSWGVDSAEGGRMAWAEFETERRW